MARIRTIKPEFWLDEDLAELSDKTKLMAIGLLNHSDDEGYFKANPAIVRAGIFPFEDGSLNIHGMLSELSSAGWIELLEGADGKSYGRIVNFLNHQTINRPTPSKIAPIVDSRNAHGGVSEDSSPERKGKERKGTGKGKEQEKGVPRELLLEWFETLWQQFDTEFGQKGSKKKAQAQFLKLAPDENQFNLIATALQSQISNKSEFKDRGQFWESFPHVERWLRDERWNDELTNPASSTAGAQQLSPRDQALYDKYPHLRPQ